MNIHTSFPSAPDLMPPGFEEGLEDWSCGDGTPASGSYASAANARVVRDDPDFGACLELRTAAARQRLRYMGEVPVRLEHYTEVSARVKVLRGPLPLVRISAFPGGRYGQRVSGQNETGPVVGLAGWDMVFEVSAVIGPEARRGVHLVWAPSVVYSHVGIDLLGEPGTVVRIGEVLVRDVTRRFLPLGPVLPGFQDL